MPPKSPAPTPNATLSWQAVLAWRMRRQHLERPAPDADLLRVVSDLCGLHAQVTSSADLTLWPGWMAIRPEPWRRHSGKTGRW